MVRVKICGITTVEDARLCQAAGAHWLGVVLTDSPRQISPDQVLVIGEAVPDARLVAVLRPDDDWLLAEVAQLPCLDAVQLHECADPARWAAVAAATGRAILPAVTAAQADAAARAVVASRDLPLVGLLLDLPKGGAADVAARDELWRAARRTREAGARVFLAGSLAATDVPDALASAMPYALDVCRGTEREPGRKDPARVRRFLAAAGHVEVNRAS